jgi:hypothetical protein
VECQVPSNARNLPCQSIMHTKETTKMKFHDWLKLGCTRGRLRRRHESPLQSRPLQKIAEAFCNYT